MVPMRIMLASFLMALAPTYSVAINAVRVAPGDVQNAFYCAELNRLLGYPLTKTDDVDVVSLNSAKLISAGDSLHEVQKGINKAKIVYDASQPPEGSSANLVTLMLCELELAERIQIYETYSCGYGQGRNNPKKINALLSRLQLSIYSDVEPTNAYPLRRWLLIRQKNPKVNQDH